MSTSSLVHLVSMFWIAVCPPKVKTMTVPLINAHPQATATMLSDHDFAREPTVSLSAASTIFKTP